MQHTWLKLNFCSFVFFYNFYLLYTYGPPQPLIQCRVISKTEFKFGPKTEKRPDGSR